MQRIIRLAFIGGLRFFLPMIGLVLYIGQSAVLADDHSRIPGKPNATPNELLQLINSSRHQYYNLGNLTVADSLASCAVNLAESSFRPSIILYALNNYLSMYELGYDMSKAHRYTERAEKLLYEVSDAPLLYRTYINISKYWLNRFEHDKALKYSHMAMVLSEKMKEPRLKAKSFLAIGKIHQANNQPIEAFQYFLNALTIAESEKDNELLLDCYTVISRFYFITKVYSKAVSYKIMAIDLITEQKDIDSMALVWAWCDLEEIGSADNQTINPDILHYIIDFSDRHKNNYLRQYVLAFLRSYYMNHDLFDELKFLYQNKYPFELMYLKDNQPIVYYRLKAIIHEVDGLNDSARHYYEKARELALVYTNKVMAANFFIRYGEFLLRINLSSEAREMFQEAYDLAESVNYLEYGLKAASMLVFIYELSGDYRNAFHYLQAERELRDQLSRMARKDEMLNLEIQKTLQMRENALRKEEQAKNRIYTLQYSLIVMIIFVLFLFLLILGSFNVSPMAIHLTAFVSFILLFEFVILLADGQIHRVTHGEPLKVIGLKIILIAFMLPLHHWVQKNSVRSIVRKGMPLRHRFRNTLGGFVFTIREIWGKWE